MYRILLATDGSKHSEKVVREAEVIAGALQAEVTVLTVMPEYESNPRITRHISDDYWEVIRKNQKEAGEEIVAKVAGPLREKGLKVNTEVVLGRQLPADVICDMAKKGDYYMVIMGSHGLRGIRETFLGSVSNKVAHCIGKNLLIIK